MLQSLQKLEKDLKETREERDKALQGLNRLKQHLLEKVCHFSGLSFLSGPLQVLMMTLKLCSVGISISLPIYIFCLVKIDLVSALFTGS